VEGADLAKYPESHAEVFGHDAERALSTSAMKKSTKRLSLTTETIRTLQADELAQVQGGSITSGTSVISVSGTSGTTIINPGTTVQSITSGTSVIRTH
jgi:hypothetical protein